MDINAAAIKDVFKQGHAEAWAKAEMPSLEINELISLVASVLGAKENQKEAAVAAAKQLAEKYRKPLQVYLDAFAVFMVGNGLKQVKLGEISKLGTEEFAAKMIEAGKNIEGAITAFCHSQIDEIVLINQLGQTGVLEVGQSLLQAAGVDLAQVRGQIQTALGNVNGVSVVFVSFYASAAAYKMLQEALQEAAVVRENRIRIEEECTKSIEMMRSYRKQMNASVSDYLYAHAETFHAGIAAMDRAILEGDVNGFLRGNAEIQEILNYKVQFRNQDEFDAIMDSDHAFVL